MGTMGNQQTKDAPAAPTYTTEYGTLGIIELKKILMEQSYPVTPGHEIAGTVSKIGPDVQGFKPGDQVLVYPWLGCDSCKTCLEGSENLCETPRSIGLFQDGGYAESVKVPSYKYLADISGLDHDSATSLACSGLTGFTAVKKANANSPEFIVIIGAGGLGPMGVQRCDS